MDIYTEYIELYYETAAYQYRVIFNRKYVHKKGRKNKKKRYIKVTAHAGMFSYPDPLYSLPPPLPSE